MGMSLTELKPVSRKPHVPTAYWWNSGVRNFGDLLTPLLFAHFAGLIVRHAPPGEADMVCAGSILEVVPKGWRGIVVGSGKMFEGTQPNLKHAKIFAVRGPLTAKGLKGDFVLGDPGLLANELAGNVDKEHILGIVPHWSDIELERRSEFQKYNPKIIRVTGDPVEVIREIGKCRKIVSSSLHGIILADAFGIPRRIEMTKAFEKEGRSFKFEDYDASVGVPFEVGVTQEAGRYKVQNRQEEIYDVLNETAKLLERK